MARTNDQTYRRNRARILVPGAVCHLCGKEIDPEIKWPDPMSGTADHIIPASQGGTDHPSNLRPAHAGCNGKRQARDVTAVAAIRTSRAW